MSSVSVPVQSAPRISAIHAWAALGALFLALQIYVFGAWIASGDARPVAPGPDPVPDFVLGAMHVFEALSALTLAGVLYWFVRGIRRQGDIDALRLMMIGWLSAYWLDPYLNFLAPTFTYNAYLFNLGCWCEFIPGWRSPHGSQIAEPLLVDGPAYFYMFAGTAWMGLWAMQRAQLRWPTLGTAGRAAFALAGILLTMGVQDFIAARFLAFDAWPRSHWRWSFSGGHYDQFPALEFVIFPVFFVACAFLLRSADGNGFTAIERGIERTSPNRFRRTVLRILAFCAFCNLCNLGYTAISGVVGLTGDPWPADMPSWLRDNQCGPLTGVECSAGVPNGP